MKCSDFISFRALVLYSIVRSMLKAEIKTCYFQGSIPQKPNLGEREKHSFSQYV